jgi:hypothetical protein
MSRAGRTGRAGRSRWRRSCIAGELISDGNQEISQVICRQEDTTDIFFVLTGRIFFTFEHWGV